MENVRRSRQDRILTAKQERFVTEYLTDLNATAAAGRAGYKAGERSAAEHIHHLLKGEPRTPICVGGSKSERQWRREFSLVAS